MEKNEFRELPCPQHDALDAGCPLHAGVWLCGVQPCIIMRHPTSIDWNNNEKHAVNIDIPPEFTKVINDEFWNLI